MCGFVGFTDMLENRKEILQHMMDRIIHRGPDMAGEYLDDRIALGFRRLSIIDLSESGRQPMTTADGMITVVFNGEIYNYQELRQQLIACGHTFRTVGDTETLLHGWEEYGEQLTPKLRGMFSFVIWDRRSETIYAARDYFGIKPFYYTHSAEGGLIFGSEIKSFLDHPGFVKKLNPRALRPYLTFQYSAMDETFFDGVFKLPPAHWLRWKAGTPLEIGSYWNESYQPKGGKTLDQWVEQLDQTVRESVQAHRIADVKVGTFLSGGIDSSYITAAMMPDQTFSVGFHYNKFNETDYASELSEILGIHNNRRLLDAKECFEALPTIQYHMDEPQSNPSCVPLYFLAKLASEQVTVVLSGEGADELFAGYDWYDKSPVARRYQKIPSFLRRGAAAVTRYLPYFKGHDLILNNSGRPEDFFIGQAMVYPEAEAEAILREPYRVGPTAREVTAPVYAQVQDCDELTKKQYLDMKLWLPGDILLKADKMSMASSLELRVPFLDRNVMAFAQTIPASYKIWDAGKDYQPGVYTKYVLRQASAKTVPGDWVWRKKAGFPVPIRYWLAEEPYYHYVKDYFTSDFAAEFFDCQALMRLLDAHRSGQANNGRKIWTALIFLIWYKRFFIDEKAGAAVGSHPGENHHE